MNPCNPTCDHYRVRQGSHSWCGHPRLTEFADTRIATFFGAATRAPKPDSPPGWCPLRADSHCEQCQAVYINIHPAAAHEHHSKTCPGTLTTNQ